ncbi:MAG: DUF932 domain-containing protein [Planctomycetes bacterium]|nr:DUF932 domain-containing protein [Planctomycetota bacterium]
MPNYFESGFFAREPAWHGLGTLIPRPVPSYEALELSGLDWDVELQSKFLEGEEKMLYEWDEEAEDHVPVLVKTLGQRVPKDFSVVRKTDGHILGRSVGAVYSTIQNTEGFKFLDSLVDDDLILYEAAGSLKGGSKVWMLARIEGEPYRVKGVDDVVPYLLATNSHDGQSSFRVFPTAVRVVCANTLSLALSQRGDRGISIRHSGDINRKIDEAKMVFGEAQKRFEQFCRQAELLAQRTLTGEELETFVNALYPSKEPVSRKVDANREQFYEEFAGGDGEHTITALEGTAWDAFNAVTRLTNHVRRPKISKDQTKTEEVYRDARFDGLFFGSGNELNQKALLYLTTLASGKDPSNILATL